VAQPLLTPAPCAPTPDPLAGQEWSVKMLGGDLMIAELTLSAQPPPARATTSPDSASFRQILHTCRSKRATFRDGGTVTGPERYVLAGGAMFGGGVLVLGIATLLSLHWGLRFRVCECLSPAQKEAPALVTTGPAADNKMASEQVPTDLRWSTRDAAPRPERHSWASSAMAANL
jgi:hypothetical protein